MAESKNPTIYELKDIAATRKFDEIFLIKDHY